MALVVRLATVIAQETHGVVLSNVLGVILHKLGDTVPQGGDGLNVLVQAEHETVLLSILVHEAEGIVVDVAEQLDRGLDTPVVFVVHHQGLAEEEARLEAAHVAVADAVAVNDLALFHILANLLGLLLVDEIRETPVFLANETIVRLARAKGCCNLLESVVEGLVIQEHPVVVVSPVETVLNLTNGLGDLPDVRVACQGNEGCVNAGSSLDAGQIVESGVIWGHGQRILGGIDVSANLGDRGLVLGVVGITSSIMAVGLVV